MDFLIFKQFLWTFIIYSITIIIVKKIITIYQDWWKLRTNQILGHNVLILQLISINYQQCLWRIITSRIKSSPIYRVPFWNYQHKENQRFQNDNSLIYNNWLISNWLIQPMVYCVSRSKKAFGSWFTPCFFVTRVLISRFWCLKEGWTAYGPKAATFGESWTYDSRSIKKLKWT